MTTHHHPLLFVCACARASLATATIVTSSTQPTPRGRTRMSGPLTNTSTSSSPPSSLASSPCKRHHIHNYTTACVFQRTHLPTHVVESDVNAVSQSATANSAKPSHDASTPAGERVSERVSERERESALPLARSPLPLCLSVYSDIWVSSRRRALTQALSSGFMDLLCIPSMRLSCLAMSSAPLACILAM